MRKGTLLTSMLYMQSLTIISSGENSQNCHREPLFRRHCWKPSRQDNPSVLGDQHDSYLMLNPEDHMPTSDVINYTNISYIKIKGNDLCAWQTGSGFISSCPHHYELNYDENRRPKELIEAKCNCDENTPCLNSTETSRCLPVKYYITVLRKNGCSGNTSTYTKAVEPITVGCTCAYQLPVVLNSNDYHVVAPE